jgi:carbonic anhydrase
MVVSCCDSRADPSAIFSAAPGELFVVRNVANLVPPFGPDGRHHSTSAALEFAVRSLKVENILVMGHARCGGVRAYLDGLYDRPEEAEFIAPWISLLHAAGGEVQERHGEAPIEERQEALEQASIRHSIDNLMGFPFIRAEVDAGRLRLRGAYFDIANGRLLALDSDGGAFSAVG